MSFIHELRFVNKLRLWKDTIDQLSAETGLSLLDVSEYLGSVYNEEGPSFYVKLPRKRSVYIGIGMAFCRSADVINDWITGFAGKRRLYAKDISEDLVWLYLINANLEDAKAISGNETVYDTSRRQNYYQRYEEYQSAAYAVFRERWDEIIFRYEDTSDVEVSLGQAEFGPEYDGIKQYVAEHMDAFKTAYSKPRAYLDMYIERILTVCRTHPGLGHIRSVNAMRGYLDDSMINFLSGDSKTINVIDRRSGKRTVSIKHVPKSRRKYIDMCLALGMTAEDLNEFLEMMGYAPLDEADADDRKLLRELTRWEDRHPLQRAMKNKYFKGDTTVELTQYEEHQAVEEMLQLRSDLRDAAEREKLQDIVRA